MSAYEWDENSKPLAYLITFRTYGTWLHGDERGSVDLHDGRNVYGTPRIPHRPKLETAMRGQMKQDPMILNALQRDCVFDAIREVCRQKTYDLYASNVRTNHAHSVVATPDSPEYVADLFKRYSTRKLREIGLVEEGLKIWARGRSRRFLWKQEHVTAAIDYVLYSQGLIPFELGSR